MTGVAEQFIPIPIRRGESLTSSMLPAGHMAADMQFIRCARLHHAPFDFDRCARYQLDSLFAAFEVEERCNDLTVAANKLIAVCARPTRPAQWPLLALAAPAALMALCVAHLALAFGRGSKNDPRGYGLCTVKG